MSSFTPPSGRREDAAAQDRCECCGMPKPNLEDWAPALEVAYTWGGYWEDDPIVHVDTGQVGFLARSFAYAMAYFGVIQKPEAT